ncbi:MAG: putative Ig domain-containing protein, partial [Candidatus Korobacteraceae bacterium]
PPYTWSASSVPAGLVMSAAGALAGTPTSPCSPCTVTVAVSDSARGSANGSFAITIAAALQVTTTSLPNGSTGVVYDQTLTATGGFTPYSWSITQGALPGGLTLNATSGLISGTPTGTGTSSFTVQVMDNGTPAASATAKLSITINPAPPRSAALYAIDRTGLQIAGNGSLSALPSNPEMAINGGTYSIGSSPTLPLLFLVTNLGTSGGPPTALESLLVNPDYSLTLYSSSAPPALGSGPGYAPAVDPSGADVYLSGSIDSKGDTGVLIYTADGSFQSVGSVAVTNLSIEGSGATFTQMTFTPDATLAFIPTCVSGGNGTILSYTRAADGLLTSAATYNLPANACPEATMVSPDGKYLVEWEFNPAVVQVFSVAADGTLTPASQRFTIMQNAPQPADLYDMVWDSSGSYLIGALELQGTMGGGGLAVLSFSGSALSQSAPPSEMAAVRIVRDGSYLYLDYCVAGECGGLAGYDFQNGQLTPLPGSPYPYGSDAGDFVIY